MYCNCTGVKTHNGKKSRGWESVDTPPKDHLSKSDSTVTQCGPFGEGKSLYVRHNTWTNFILSFALPDLKNMMWRKE